MRFWFLAANVLLVVLLGCGTTRWTNTKRSATEQLLISDAMDRAVSRFDFRALAGKKVYLDATQITKVTDYHYLASVLRQHVLASGCLLKDKREDADYIVEVRAGAVGTDQHNVLIGIPANDLPSIAAIPGMPASIPEIALAKKTEQRAIAKIAVFAYNRRTGRPVWQSGSIPMKSNAKDLWVLGAGPFQQGSIYEGMNFAGEELKIPLIDTSKKRKDSGDIVSVTDEAYFTEPEEQIVETDDKQKESGDEPDALTTKDVKREKMRVRQADARNIPWPAESQPAAETNELLRLPDTGVKR